MPVILLALLTCGVVFVAFVVVVNVDMVSRRRDGISEDGGAKCEKKEGR